MCPCRGRLELLAPSWIPREISSRFHGFSLFVFESILFDFFNELLCIAHRAPVTIHGFRITKSFPVTIIRIKWFWDILPICFSFLGLSLEDLDLSESYSFSERLRPKIKRMD